MTAQTITPAETRKFTGLEKLWAWLRAIDDGVTHDPRDQFFEAHKRLNQQVARLQATVQDLETRVKQEA